MKNPWYWKCELCGAEQPAHPDTTPEQMETCQKWVKTGRTVTGDRGFGNPEYGICGGKFVKYCNPEWDDEGRPLTPCPKADHKEPHEWGIDEQHSNIYCKQCFVSLEDVKKQVRGHNTEKAHVREVSGQEGRAVGADRYPGCDKQAYRVSESNTREVV